MIEHTESDEEESDESMDADYEEFIEKYGHLDFRLLRFVPKIKSK